MLNMLSPQNDIRKFMSFLAWKLVYFHSKVIEIAPEKPQQLASIHRMDAVIRTSDNLGCGDINE